MTSVTGVSFYPRLETTIHSLIKEFPQISNERIQQLAALSAFVQKKLDAGAAIKLIFICTHNSRRSHLAQLWAQTAAAYYNIPNLRSFSGGTEATAFNERAVNALRKVGFEIDKVSQEENPLYEVSFSPDGDIIEAYSKRYDAHSNPKEGFAAVMTCSHADENCPVVFGMEERISLPYDDPKDFDGTEIEALKYLERACEIGRDILYALSQVRP